MATAWLRIDDRLIHGQVVVVWVPHLRADRIVVVSDDAAADETQRLLMRMAVPDGVAIEVVGQAEAWPRLKTLLGEDGRVLILTPSPHEALELLEAGLRLPAINVGGLHYSVGKVQIGRAIFLTERDREDLKAIAAKGVELDARAVPSDKGLPLAHLLEEHA